MSADDSAARGWPVAELDPVRRMRVLAASIPGVAYSEAFIDVPFDRVWAYIDDIETSMPALITDIRRFRVVERSGDRLTAKAVGMLGNRGTFDVVLRPGWCVMQSRLVIGGMAATPENKGTRFAWCGGLRFPGGSLLAKVVVTHDGTERIMTKLRTQLR